MGLLKKRGYLKRLKKAIELAPNHPRHHNVKMQAHHLVSAKGVDLAGFSDDLRNLGYDINVTENLTFIPSTLQGACHLECQLHRGDHGSSDPDAFDDDDQHDDSYHKEVKGLLKEKFRRKKICELKLSEIKRKMNSVSNDLVTLINNHEIGLTSMHTFFKNGGKGCAGVDNIPSYSRRKRLETCPVDRDHTGKQGTGQDEENITYPKPETKYQLKVKR